MKISINSWHYRFHKMTFEDKPATNLCPYFWKLLWGILWFPINFLMTLPLTIVDKIAKKITGDSITDMEDEPYFSGRWALSFVFNIVLFVATSMIIMWWYLDDKKAIFITVLGTIGWCALLFLGIRFLILTYREKYPKKYKEHSPNILLEMIKAKKEKYCPKIEWTK